MSESAGKPTHGCTGVRYISNHRKSRVLFGEFSRTWEIVRSKNKYKFTNLIDVLEDLTRRIFDSPSFSGSICGLSDIIRKSSNFPEAQKPVSETRLGDFPWPLLATAAALGMYLSRKKKRTVIGLFMFQYVSDIFRHFTSDRKNMELKSETAPMKRL